MKLEHRLTHLSLFSGIGGIDLAVEWAGFQTVCFCEKDKYCQRVLRKHWPNIPIIEDVKDVTKEKVMAYARCFGQTECQKQATRLEQCGEAIISYSSGQGLRQSASPLCSGRLSPLDDCASGIDLISGGFPCQPHSVAGKRKGSGDERNLWPEFRRVIGEIRPKWVLAENVPGLFSSDSGRFFGNILADLAALGYSVGWCTFGAVDVGALHRRDRVFIVAHALNDSDRGGRRQGGEKDGLQGINRAALRSGLPCGTGGQSRPMAYTSIKGLEGAEPEGRTSAERLPAQCGECQEFFCESCPFTNTKSESSNSGNRQGGNKELREFGGYLGKDGGPWAVEPNVGRVANGVPHRVDRLKTLGNAVVPQQIYPILKAIADCEVLL